MHLHCELLLFMHYFHTSYIVCACACMHGNSHLCDAQVSITCIDAQCLAACILHLSIIAWSASWYFTSPNYCRPFTHNGDPSWTSFHSFELWFAPTHTHTHRNTCIPSADPLWCLIPPHFSRPLPLSNWSRSEYNYGENHPGLMWGWINGIKKIICWPSGPATVWGWEGNLKQKEEERRGALMSRRTESWWPLRALLGLSLQGLLSTRLPTTIAPYSSHLAKSFEGVQSNSEGAVK